MPRKDEPDNPLTGKPSPEPPKESSPSPELVCEGRSPPENRESSVDPTVQEMGEASGDYLEDPSSAVSDAVSEESVCSRCGGSKSSRDKDIKTLAPTQPICECDHELNKIQQESKRGTLDVEVSEGATSDALSNDSICSKCGRSKRNKSTDLKPEQFLCKCRHKKDEVQEIENVPLQEIPGVAVGTEETSQIETFKDQNPDLRGKGSPPKRDPPETNLNKGERRERRIQRDEESCIPDCPDISWGNCHWKLTLTIVSVIGTIFTLFVYLIIRELITKHARGKGSG